MKHQDTYARQYIKDSMPKVIFCPTMYENIEDDIKKSRNPNSVSGHKFQQNIIKGLIDNHMDVRVVNIPRIRPYPDYPKVFIKKSPFVYGDKVIGMNIGFINLPVLSRLTKSISFHRELKKIIVHNRNHFVLMTFNSHNIQSKEFLKFKNTERCYTCDIVADLHGQNGLTNKTKGIRGKCIRKIEAEQDSLAKLFDSYVLLTKEMADAIPVKKKPYTVLEGMYTVQVSLNSFSCRDGVGLYSIRDSKSKEKTQRIQENDNIKSIFYAGAVSFEYGIEHLLSAFALIEDKDYLLYIAGMGDAVDFVKEKAKKDARIQFLGVITPEQVQVYQKDAAVLVSPRKNDHEYVKYSFPSKTMECLASGVPYIAHKLACEPGEYGKYIQYPQDESDLALKNEIIRICSLSKAERELLGKAGKKFIEEQKNPKIMCERIISMIMENAPFCSERKQG